MSRTRIVISAVPDLAGFPPSTAVTNRIGAFNTSSGIFVSSWVFTFNTKLSLSLIL
uniref:Uncharacterized protein n=1 Tax=Esox lucius TaxID=8010 RepID=A0A3P8YB32_ESOLU